MRAIIAEDFGGYQNLKPANIPRPARSDGRVLVRMTAAGVTPLDHTILSGNYPKAKAPLVLGNEDITRTLQAHRCSQERSCGYAHVA
jgi:NADPH2:quinone reductase